MTPFTNEGSELHDMMVLLITDFVLDHFNFPIPKGPFHQKRPYSKRFFQSIANIQTTIIFLIHRKLQFDFVQFIFDCLS